MNSPIEINLLKFKRGNMFIQSCLIRKNTKKLRDMLIAFGYKIPPKQFFEDRESGLLCRGKLAIGVPENSHEFNLDEYLKNNPFIIDCGTNEELFLALAALRKDSDKYQWFTDLSGHWEKCIYDEGSKFIWLDANLNFKNSYKATVKELINHFTNKN